VLKNLTLSGYRVQTQWRVGAFRIDMVVFGAEGARVALECDGDRYHPPEDLDRDLDRQRILERLGWRFVRVRGSAFFRDPESTMARVRRQMTELGVEPIGADCAPTSSEGTTDLRDRIVRRAEELRAEWAAEASARDSELAADDDVEIEDADGPSGRGGAGQMDGPDVVAVSSAMLAAIREARVPIARAEIIERSGISPTQWTVAIRRLLSEGAIVRHGSKRGAKYSFVLSTMPGSEPELFAAS
jgi:very-short-patch-repair endonuclease